MTKRLKRLQRVVQLNRARYRQELAELGTLRRREIELGEALEAANKRINQEIDNGGGLTDLLARSTNRIGGDLVRTADAAARQVDRTVESLARVRALERTWTRERDIDERETEEREAGAANDQVGQAMAARLRQAN